ncbi:MAG: SAM-dependent methyltransferase [Betaproteobacteria bacterium]
MTKPPGTLYLVPTTLGGDAAAALPESTLSRLCALRSFIVEDAKSARHFLKAVRYPHPLQQVQMRTLNEHTPEVVLPELLTPMLEGEDCGLLAEAGCPAVADPGALLVRLAHRRGIRVVPLVGPSALLLALMASGLNGQRFAFHGYLPVHADARRRKLQELEHDSVRSDCTQMFIEAPYRNDAMFRAVLEACRDDTLVCIAADLSMATESIATRTVEAWRGDQPTLDRRPTVFLLYSAQKR